MSKQDDILGKHPAQDQLFGTWLKATDEPEKDDYCHRSLTENNSLTADQIEDLANRLIHYHYKPINIKSLQKKYAKIGFPQFASSEYFKNSRMLPNDDNTRKGNATEMLMQEYCLASINRTKDLVYVYRFQYSPNIDQSMKGDDMLIVNIANRENPVFFLGEAKFRSNPDAESLKQIKTSLSKGKIPISMSFLKNCFEDNSPEIYSLLDDYLTKSLSNYDIRYIGFLLSTDKCNDFVKNHWTCDNPNHVMLSLGMNNPSQFIIDLFNKATDILKTPDTIK